MNLRTTYLILAIIGALVPYTFFLGFMNANGADIGAFVAGLFANGAAGGFSADLLISSLAFWLFMFSRRQSGPAPWPYILLNLLIGLSCALPAYLYAISLKSDQL